MHVQAYPEFFDQQRITGRIPYTMPGELILAASQSGVQFPESQFLHNVDKPFEIWRMVARVTPMLGDELADLEVMEESGLVTSLEKRVRLSVLDVSKNERITKNPQLISSLLKSNERTWEWPIPYTIVRQEGLQVTCQSDAFPSICLPNPIAIDPADECDVQPFAISFVRVEVVFEGYLVIVAPPGNR